MSWLKHVAAARPLLFAVCTTLLFVLLLVVVIVMGRVLPGERGTETWGIVGRGLLAALFVWLIRRFGWLGPAGLAGPGDRRAWGIVAGPLLYVIVVFPLLFTGDLSLSFSDPALLLLVAGNGFAAGVMEEVVFRGFILSTLVQAWGRRPRGVAMSLLASSLLFSVPHALNVLAGQDVTRVLAQLVWAALLGGVFGMLVLVGESLWPVAALHGLGNAFVHANRVHRSVVLSSSSAVLSALAPIPLVIYALILMRRKPGPVGAART